MSAPFVWFDNAGSNRNATADFLTALFGWKPQDVAPRVFLSEDGQDMPFALTCDTFEGISGWVPYVEVQDLDTETKKAADLGGQVIAEAVKGPAGMASFVKDPGGSVIALWTRG